MSLWCVLHIILHIAVTSGLTSVFFMGPLGKGSWNEWERDHLFSLLGNSVFPLLYYFISLLNRYNPEQPLRRSARLLLSPKHALCSKLHTRRWRHAPFVPRTWLCSWPVDLFFLGDDDSFRAKSKPCVFGFGFGSSRGVHDEAKR